MTRLERWSAGAPLVLGLLLVSVVGACGSGGRSTPSSGAGQLLRTPSAVADAMRKVGLECGDYQPVAAADKTYGVDKEGSCSLDGENLSLFTFKDTDQRRNFEGVGSQSGCQMGKAFGFQTWNFVRGDLWIVQPETRTVAEEVAKKLRVKSVSVKC